VPPDPPALLRKVYPSRPKNWIPFRLVCFGFSCFYWDAVLGDVGGDILSCRYFMTEVTPQYTVVGTGKVFHPNLPPNWDLNYSWDPRMSNGEWEPWMYVPPRRRSQHLTS
jgi:hypothetical protein